MRLRNFVLVAEHRRRANDRRLWEALAHALLAERLGALEGARRVDVGAERRYVNKPLHSDVGAHLREHCRESGVHVSVRKPQRLKVLSHEVDDDIALGDCSLDVRERADRGLDRVHRSEIARQLEVPHVNLVITVWQDQSCADLAKAVDDVFSKEAA